MAHILTLPVKSSILSKSNALYLEEVTKSQLSNLFAKMKQLAEKGYLIKKDDGYFIHPTIQKFQSFVKEKQGINYKFTLPLTIEQ